MNISGRFWVAREIKKTKLHFLDIPKLTFLYETYFYIEHNNA